MEWSQRQFLKLKGLERNHPSNISLSAPLLRMHNKKPTRVGIRRYEVKVANTGAFSMRGRELESSNRGKNAQSGVGSRRVTDPTGSVLNERGRDKKSGIDWERRREIKRRKIKSKVKKYIGGNKVKEIKGGGNKEHGRRYHTLGQENTFFKYIVKVHHLCANRILFFLRTLIDKPDSYTSRQLESIIFNCSIVYWLKYL